MTWQAPRTRRQRWRWGISPVRCAIRRTADARSRADATGRCVFANPASFGGEVCIVALTGWGQWDDRRRTREAGFDHHLVKLVDFTEIERLLGDCVRAAS